MFYYSRCLRSWDRLGWRFVARPIRSCGLFSRCPPLKVSFGQNNCIDFVMNFVQGYAVSRVLQRVLQFADPLLKVPTALALFAPKFCDVIIVPLAPVVVVVPLALVVPLAPVAGVVPLALVVVVLPLALGVVVVPLAPVGWSFPLLWSFHVSCRFSLHFQACRGLQNFQPQVSSW